MYLHSYEKMIYQDRLFKFGKEKPTVTGPKIIFRFSKCPKKIVFPKNTLKSDISNIIGNSGILNLKIDIFCIIWKSSILLDQKCSFSFRTEKRLSSKFCIIGKDDISFSC